MDGAGVTFTEKSGLRSNFITFVYPPVWVKAKKLT